LKTKTLRIEVPVPADEYDDIMERLQAGAPILLDIGEVPDGDEEEESECHVDQCEACAMPAQREVSSALSRASKMMTVLTPEGDEELVTEDGMAISGIPAESHFDTPTVFRCVFEDIDALRESLETLEDMTNAGGGSLGYRLQRINVEAAHSHLSLLHGEVERIAMHHGQ